VAKAVASFASTCRALELTLIPAREGLPYAVLLPRHEYPPNPAMLMFLIAPECNTCDVTRRQQPPCRGGSARIAKEHERSLASISAPFFSRATKRLLLNGQRSSRAIMASTMTANGRFDEFG
jgi:hypothetical protein